MVVGVTTRIHGLKAVYCACSTYKQNEELWTYLTMHDLWRTWATSLKGAEVDAMLVCDWGGWSDLETFLGHYRGKFSPEAQARQRAKVDWL